MTDADLLALCVLEEAGGESDDGRAAIARTIKNRMALRFMSDGTIPGTVLARNQFSWAWFDFVDGKYRRVSKTLADAENLAEKTLAAAPPIPFLQCSTIASEVMAGTYHGTLYDQLTDDVVSYLNPRLVELPTWATPDKLVCIIGNQNFYRA